MQVLASGTMTVQVRGFVVKNSVQYPVPPYNITRRVSKRLENLCSRNLAIRFGLQRAMPL